MVNKCNAASRAPAGDLTAAAETTRARPAPEAGIRAQGWLALGGGVLAGALLAAAIGLWARHGSAVFFDLIAAGIAACF